MQATSEKASALAATQVGVAGSMGSLEMICLWCLCRPCSPWDQVIIKLLCSLCCRARPTALCTFSFNFTL